uniref:Arrestin_N domain-containing protein n=1 Tax=Mesocestoides corti TaxID=53468 RepID=A0A5K3F868_MESCO
MDYYMSASAQNIPVDIIRLELDGENIPSYREIDGRIFLDLNNSVKVQNITLVVAKSMNITSTNGKIQVINRGIERIRHLAPTATTQSRGGYYGYNNAHNSEAGDVGSPKSITTINPITDVVTLGTGEHAIPFTLWVPKTEMPSFTYVNPANGTVIVNCYALYAEITINGKTYRTDAISIWVPAIGRTSAGLGFSNGDREMAIEKKFVTRDAPIRAVFGDTTSEVKKVRARVVARIQYHPARLQESVEIIPWTSLKRKSGAKSDVLESYNSDNYNQKLAGDWKHYWESTTFQLGSSLPPTVNLHNFRLEYLLQLDDGDTVYEAPVILVDELSDEEITPPQISADMLRKSAFSVQ